MADDDQLALARRLHKATGGSREDTISGLQNLGYSKQRAGELTDQVAPKLKPAPAKPSSTPAPTSTPTGSSAGPSPTGDSSGTGGGGGGGERRQPKPAASSRRPSSGGSAAGVLLAILAYPPFLAWLTGGTDGLKRWGRAKFLNQVTAAAPTTSSGVQTKPAGPAPKVVGA